jgi:small subunit ribosomal protein S17
MSEENTASSKTERRIVGRVVSDKMNKTVTVLVERRVRHPLYGKYVKKSTRLHVHDENNESHEGDKVAVVETRPLSRSKRFRLVEILERASSAARVESAS